MLSIFRQSYISESTVDVRAIRDSPVPDGYEMYFRDIFTGMRRAGVDADLSHLKNTCRSLSLSLEITPLRITQPSQEISQDYITSMIQVIKDYFEFGIIEETIDRDYQFLKYVGWEESDVRNFYFTSYSPTAVSTFLETRMGERISFNRTITLIKISLKRFRYKSSNIIDSFTNRRWLQ